MSQLDALEYLAVLLSSRKLALSLLERTTLAHLSSAEVSELERFLPPTFARRLHAAMRLGAAVLMPELPESLNSPKAAFAHIFPFLAGAETERMLVVCCNSQFQPLHTEVVAQGAVNTVSTLGVDLFAPVIRHRAQAIFLAHNHPSQDPTPSVGDIRSTEQMLRVAEVLGVRLLDHLVVGGRAYRSIRDEMARQGLSWHASEATLHG